MPLTRDEIDRMTPSERLDLIEQLWDSLSNRDVPLSPAQETEIDRRLANLDRDRANALPWDRLRDEMARRCP
jgi:putative addiction module component (TIGR02574 family)